MAVLAYAEIELSPLGEVINEITEPMQTDIEDLFDETETIRIDVSRRIQSFHSNIMPDSGSYAEYPVTPGEQFEQTIDQLILFENPSNVHVMKYDDDEDETDIYEDGHAELVHGFNYVITGSWSSVKASTYVTGDIWVNESNNTFTRYNGSIWEDVLSQVIDQSMNEVTTFIDNKRRTIEESEKMNQYVYRSEENGAIIVQNEKLGEETDQTARMKLTGASITFTVGNQEFTKMGAGYQQVGQYQMRTVDGGLAWFFDDGSIPGGDT